METIIVNAAGAKIYKDISKHEFLRMPVLFNEKAKGFVYDVLSFEMNDEKDAIVTVRELNREAIAYRLPNDLNEWVMDFIGLRLKGIISRPLKVEFSIFNRKAYAKII